MSTSDNLVLEKKATLPAEPFVITEKYILKKHKAKPPSLILHLYPNYFRFDQQDGSFSYHSEMRVFIEHLRKGTIPHDMLEELRIGNVRFYDGWILVKIIDHKSVAVDQKASNGVADDEKPYSIHNYNHFITPSPCVPYPTKEQLAHSPSVKLERNGSATGDKENLAPEVKNEQSADYNSKSAKTEPKVFWKALQPTQLSRHVDLTLDYIAPDPKARKAQANTRQAGQPPTPSGTVPPTPISERPPPLKKQKLKIEPKDHLEYEARLVNATAPPLYLEAARDLEDVERIHKMLADPICKEPPPSPKSRKRTVAELAADDAHAKEQERFMLIMDARSSAPGVTTNNAGVDPQAGPGTFQARFERFNALDNIKRDLEEKKKRDNEKRLQEDELRRSQQQQHQEEQQRKQAQQAAIAQKREQAMIAAKQQQQQQMQQRQNQEALAQAQAQAQAQQQNAGQVQQPQQPTMNAQQGQRRGTGQQPNGIPPQMQNQIMAQAASPIVRQGTPHAASSPIAPNARPMARNGSQTGGAGSPARPGSSLQHAHPNTANMIRQASGQGGPSRNGTPQIPHSTPGMNSATPILRQGTPAHAMTQASPMVSMAMATPQMGQTNMQAQMPNGIHPGLTAQQQQQLAQQMQRRQMANQQALQNMNNGQGPTGPQMAQLQAQHQAQLERAAAMQRQQQAQAAMSGTPQPQHMSPAPNAAQAAQYNAQVRKQMMQQMGAQQGGAGSPAPNQGQSQMSPQQMQAMQMAQQQRQHAQQQQQQMQAMQGAQGQQAQQMMAAQARQRAQQAANPLFQQVATQIYKQLFAQELQNYQGNAQLIPANVMQQLKVRAQREAQTRMARQAQQQQMGMQNNAQMMQQGGNAMMQQNSQQGNGMVPQGNMMAMQQGGQQVSGMQNMQNMQNMMGMQGMQGMNVGQMQNGNQSQTHAQQMQQLQIQNAQQQMMQNNYMQMMGQMQGQQGQPGQQR